MRLPLNLKSIIPLLTLSRESDHFITHYGLKNPRIGIGLGSNGVPDDSLIKTYSAALESLYLTMTAKPWERDSPLVNSDRKTHVYVLNSEPLTHFDQHRVPYIFLPSRNNEPTAEAASLRAASEAVHEATHLFNFTQRPHYDLNSKPWAWIDEGFAVLMEMLVAPGNPDYFRFLMDWIDNPDLPLDHDSGKYQAGMFLKYVVKKLGAKFVDDVWTKSLPKETPLEALERLMPDSQRFFSSDANVQDVFCSGYCIERYYLWELASDVFRRYGEKAISESLVLSKTETIVSGVLDHLSCRYYRFYLDENTTAVKVSMTVDDPCETTPLKAEIALVTTGKSRITLKSLTPTASTDGSDGCLSCSLVSLNAKEIDHLVLVVSNSGTNLNALVAEKQDDRKTFSIRVSAS